VPLQTVREQLQSRYPEAFELVCFTAVNGEMVRDDARVLADGDEVVFMSKFSGG
jgi:molybdopterin converting factor small subunit